MNNVTVSGFPKLFATEEQHTHLNNILRITQETVEYYGFVVSEKVLAHLRLRLNEYLIHKVNPHLQYPITTEVSFSNGGHQLDINFYREDWELEQTETPRHRIE